MNATTLEPAPPRTVARPSGAPPEAPGRPRRRTGRGTGPEARPPRPLPPPGWSISAGSRPQACSLPAVSPVPFARPSQWRLTERGIALVLVTGLLIVVAALAVVGLTALRVTGERYSDVGHSVLAQP